MLLGCCGVFRSEPESTKTLGPSPSGLRSFPEAASPSFLYWPHSASTMNPKAKIPSRACAHLNLRCKGWVWVFTKPEPQPHVATEGQAGGYPGASSSCQSRRRCSPSLSDRHRRKGFAFWTSGLGSWIPKHCTSILPSKISHQNLKPCNPKPYAPQPCKAEASPRLHPAY